MGRIKYINSKIFFAKEYNDGIIVAFKNIGENNLLCADKIYQIIVSNNFDENTFASDIIESISDMDADKKNIEGSLYIYFKNECDASDYDITIFPNKNSIDVKYNSETVLTIKSSRKKLIEFWGICILLAICIFYYFCYNQNSQSENKEYIDTPKIKVLISSYVLKQDTVYLEHAATDAKKTAEQANAEEHAAVEKIVEQVKADAEQATTDAIKAAEQANVAIHAQTIVDKSAEQVNAAKEKASEDAKIAEQAKADAENAAAEAKKTSETARAKKAYKEANVAEEAKTTAIKAAEQAKLVAEKITINAKAVEQAKVAVANAIEDAKKAAELAKTAAERIAVELKTVIEAKTEAEAKTAAERVSKEAKAAAEAKFSVEQAASNAKTAATEAEVATITVNEKARIVAEARLTAENAATEAKTAAGNAVNFSKTAEKRNSLKKEIKGYIYTAELAYEKYANNLNVNKAITAITNYNNALVLDSIYKEYRLLTPKEKSKFKQCIKTLEKSIKL